MITKYPRICLCGCKTFFYASDYRSKFIKGHFRKFQIGEKAPGWKGGIIKKRGYVFIYNPTHPHADQEYVKRSRLVMEKKIGRYLKFWEFVHHINGIRDDDRIENLVLTSHAEHNSIHRKGKHFDRIHHKFI